MTTKRISQQLDSVPRTLYAPQEADSLTAYPVIANGEGSLHVALPGHLCPDNSTTTPLGIDGVYTGAWEDTVNYATIIIGIIADQNSATDGLAIEWSADGVTKTQDDVFTISANSGKVFTFCPANQYFRVKYTNGGVAQTSFNLQVIMKKTDIKGSSHRINDSIVSEDDAELVKAVITGENPAGTFVNFQATTAGNFKVSLEELETGISSNSKSQLNITPFDVDGNTLAFQPRTQTPTGNVLQVQIGPGDIISNLPIFVDYDHHQVHEGETFRSEYVDLALETNVVKFAIVVPTFSPADATTCPHMLLAVDVYNGSAKVQLYEGATYTGGTPLTAYNRERNSANTAATTTVAAVTSTTGTLLETFFVGSGRSTAGEGRSGSEFILKSNTTYRVDLTGLAAGTDAIMSFNWYEDLGV